MKKKLLCAFLYTAMAVALLTGCGCGNTDSGSGKANKPEQPGSTDTDDSSTGKETGAPGEGKKIAIAMPGGPSGQWADDAENMKKGLEAKGYAVEVKYAEDDPKKQSAQMEEFAKGQADCIVVAAEDPGALTKAAGSARDAKIPVIAYDRLLMDTDAVTYYVTFGQKGIGISVGQAVIEKAGLDRMSEGGYKTIEFFMGSPDDGNARLFYEGLMEALQPYLDNGKLTCKTGRTSFEDTAIQDWSQETAQQWCKSYLEGYYTDEELDICVAASDSFAYGCKKAFEAAGYIQDNWPLISGQGCELLACKNILDGTQAFSVYKDTRVLAERCVTMADAAASGTETQINDTEQYDNNKLIVPAYLCETVLVDKDNLQETIIESGYYTAGQIDAAE